VDIIGTLKIIYRTLSRICLFLLYGPLHASLNEHSLKKAGRFFLIIIFSSIARAERLFAMPWLFQIVRKLSASILQARQNGSLHLPGIFWLISHEDRATQGCDPSACGSRKAGRGADTFLGRPPYHLCRYWLSSGSGLDLHDIE